MGMIILVCGSRNWRDVGAIRAALLLLPRDSQIIHGGAKGADSLAGVVAGELGLPALVYLPDWEKEGRSAGFQSNIRMLDAKPDKVIAFWDGESRGTQHTIREAQKRGIPVQIVTKTSEN